MNDFIEPIFNMHKIKFDKLDELGLFYPTTKRANIFINLEAVFKVLINQRVENQLRATGYDKNQLQLDFISGIINLGQHYRLYCKKNKIDSKIILFWNYPRSTYKNREYIGRYRDDYDKKMFRSDICPYIVDTLSEVHDLLTTTVSYVNEVYVVDGGVAESSMVPYILTRDDFLGPMDDSVQNIIISRFRYDYQYLGHGFTVLIPARDDSEILTLENVVDYMKERTNIKNPLTVPGEQLPTLISILGDDHRGIPKLDGFGLSGACKTINGAIQSLKIASTTQSVELLCEIIPDHQRRTFINNYRCVEFGYQMSELTPKDISYIQHQIEDKFNDDTLNELNETTFRDCPLMIISPRTEQVRNGERFHYDIKSIFS